MVVDDILIYAGFLKNNLQTFLDYWSKGVQILADTLFDSGNDNSHELLLVPPEFYSTVYNENRSYMFTDRFNATADGSGNQPFLYACLVKLENGELNYIDYTLISQDVSPWWSYLTNAEIEELMTIEAEHDYNLHAFSEYPDEPFEQYFGNDNNFYFRPHSHNASDAGYDFTGYLNGTYDVHKTYSTSINFISGDFEKVGDRVDFSFFLPGITGGGFSALYKQPFMLVTSDLSAVNYYISNNDAAHNYTDIVTTGDGDGFTIYYGDNYIIYYIPSGNKVSYSDLQTSAQTAVNVIVSDNPGLRPIHVPTYEENKQGPEPPSPDYEDDPWSGVSFSGASVGGIGAFAKIYYMTSTELANLRSWMASINVPEGFDPMAQIVSLSQVPVELSGDAPENVVFINSSAVYDPGVTSRAVDSGVATQQSMGLPIKYSLGSIDIERRMEERGEPYLDYDCQIELYLPLVGCFSLDTQAVMGRTITAEAVLDPISGTLAAYAWVEKDAEKLPIAYGSTTIGVDLPVSAQQYSISRAALKQANAQLGTSLLSSALTLIAAQASGGKGASSGAKTATGTNGIAAAGIREAGADYMKASQAGNVFGDFMQWGRTIRQLSYGNNTAISGSFGGSTAQWSYPFDAYVKIIRPRFKKPENYNHSQGVPCIKTMTIGECTGFIQCVGVDVSGITRATDLERQAIQAALCNGVYAGGGEE